MTCKNICIRISKSREKIGEENVILGFTKKNQFVPVPSGPVDRVRVEHPRSKRKLSPVKTREKNWCGQVLIKEPFVSF